MMLYERDVIVIVIIVTPARTDICYTQNVHWHFIYVYMYNLRFIIME